jgi:hypothetical protein
MDPVQCDHISVPIYTSILFHYFILILLFRLFILFVFFIYIWRVKNNDACYVLKEIAWLWACRTDRSCGRWTWLLAPLSSSPRGGRLGRFLEFRRRRGHWGGSLSLAHYVPSPNPPHPPSRTFIVSDLHPLSGAMKEVRVQWRSGEHWGLMKEQMGAALCKRSNSGTLELSANIAYQESRWEHSSSTSYLLRENRLGLGTLGSEVGGKAWRHQPSMAGYERW